MKVIYLSTIWMAALMVTNGEPDWLLLKTRHLNGTNSQYKLINVNENKTQNVKQHTTLVPKANKGTRNRTTLSSSTPLTPIDDDHVEHGTDYGASSSGSSSSSSEENSSSGSDSGDGRGCNDVIRRQFSEKGKQMLLERHNELRRRVAKGEEVGNPYDHPQAANMRKLVWSAKLEAKAQQWADGCIYKHSPDVRGEDIGENIAYSSDTDLFNEEQVYKECVEMLDGFYEEVEDFDPKYIDPYVHISGTGHYTQMVWAETAEVGCGMVYYEKGDSDEKKRAYLVCNYEPAGNIKKHAMYKKGEPCTACPDGFSACEDGLCVKGEKESKEEKSDEKESKKSSSSTSSNSKRS